MRSVSPSRPVSAKSAEPSSAGPGQIQSVQALRAVAALAVVAFHSTVLWHDKASGAPVRPWENGNAGVDLFFVISGFIMVLSSRSLAGRKDGWSRFLVLRLIRVVPLYWLATAAKYAATTAAPGLSLHTQPTAWNTIASFLFIPAYNAAGVMVPLLPVGWTLSFEMLFYAVFTMALFLAVDPVAFVAPVMLLLAAASGVVPADWPAFTSLANPLVLEFALGMLVARAFSSRTLGAVPAWLALPAGLAGLLCLGLVPTEGGWQRFGIWGMAAGVTLMACLALEPLLARIMPRLLVRLGEASYSLYLTHGFFLPVLGVVVFRLGLPRGATGVVLVASCLVASSAAALLVYRFVELPLTMALRRLFGHLRPPKPTSLGTGPFLASTSP